MIIVGIDPGFRGAVAVNSDDSLVTTPFKKTPEGLLDITGIRELAFLDNKVTVFLEDVHSIPNSSAKSNFQFGRCLGMIEMALYIWSIEVHYVQPKVWQKEVWTEEDKVYKQGKVKRLDTKGTSLNACNRLYPNVNLLATPRSKVPHDGIVDAILIAHYGKLKLNLDN